MANVKEGIDDGMLSVLDCPGGVGCVKMRGKGFLSKGANRYTGPGAGNELSVLDTKQGSQHPVAGMSWKQW